MSTDIYILCDRLLSATVNGVYQGVLIAALAGVALYLLGRTNAATRQAVWFGTLLVVTALIPLHLVLDGRTLFEFRSAANAAELGDAALVATQPNVENTASTPVDLAETKAMESTAAVDEEELAMAENVNIDALMEDQSASPVPVAMRARQSRGLEAAVHLPYWMSLCLVSGWLFITAIRGGIMALRLVDIRRAKKAARAADPALQTLFDKLCSAGAAKRKVRLRISATHRGPALLGFRQPVIILPAEMELETNGAEVADVLLHELAHVNRYDDWGNLVQQMIQCALFFHPAIWWISARLTLEREIACDDHVLEAVDRPRAYALTLANMASRMNQHRHSLSPGVSSSGSQLKQRINMILNTQRDRSPRLARSRLGFITTATALLAVLAMVAGPRMVIAEAQKVEDKVPDALALNSSADKSGGEAQAAATESESTQPAPAIAPVPPVAPVLPALPTKPVPPRAARTIRGSATVEDRLDRIERMLEKLETREGEPGQYSRTLNQALVAKRSVDANKYAMELAKKQIEEQKNDSVFQYQRNWQFTQPKIQVQELEALRNARESLQRQLEHMDQQIKQLEKQQVEQKQPGLDKVDDGDEAPKSKTPAAKKAH